MTCIGPRRGSLAAELAGWAPAPGRPPQLRRVTMNCVSIRVRGAGVPRELEEVPMPIVGGLDIHRKQITFDYLDTVTGEVRRGQITPADRAHLRAWLARFAGRDDVAFAMEGCTGWRYVAGELAAASIAAHVGEPADTAFARGRKRHAKTDKTDSRHLRQLLADGRLPECWTSPRCGPPRPRTCHRPGNCRSPPPWTCSPPSRPAWTCSASSSFTPPATSPARKCSPRGSTASGHWPPWR